MAKPVIKVENLGKKYLLGRGQRVGSLREALTDGVKGVLGRARRSERRGGREEFWALQEVGFEVAQGEVIGLVGRNGAGKSTLLKVLSRITEPTTGRITLRGRVASLLEVGTGFHPELSGRENIFLNGAILGMTRAEIQRKFDEIVAFAEIEKFLETPVKRYSSGMYVRLAFAVAAHLEPEILLVDEVLAVGDAQFQKKCLGKMSEVAREEGRTVFFVSHNLTAVQSLCRRAIWLREGRLVEDGLPGPVVARYLNTSYSPLTERTWPEDGGTEAPNKAKAAVRLRKLLVRPQTGQPSDPIDVRTPFLIEADYWNGLDGAYLNVTFQLFNLQGIEILAALPMQEPVWNGQPFPVGLFRSRCYVPGDLLNDGTYHLRVLVVKNQSEILVQLNEALVFEVRDNREGSGNWFGEWSGAVRPKLVWETQYHGPAALLDAPSGQSAPVEPVRYG